jgi:catechol 2,3-dioxygenase
MAPTRPSGPLDIWHIAFEVADLGRSVAFYCGCLGFDLVGRDAEQAFVSLGKRGFTLELCVRPANEAAAPRRAPDHIAFEAFDLDAYRETLIASGLAVPKPEVFDDGLKRLSLSDPDGLRLDFFQGRDGFEAFISGAS